MVALLDHLRAPAAVRFTREDCERMRELGLLPAQFELVNGEVIAQMGQNVPHATVVKRMVNRFIRVFGEAFVLTQASIDVSPEDNPTSEPAPDVLVLVKPDSELGPRPAAKDIHLLIEVADTTLAYDLDEKGPLYARAGIPEYWVADVNRRQIHRHRDPRNGVYRDKRLLLSDDPIEIQTGMVVPTVALFDPLGPALGADGR